MSVVRPSELVAADSILDAVTYHADPNRWSGDPLMVRLEEAFSIVCGGVFLFWWGCLTVYCWQMVYLAMYVCVVPLAC